MKSTKDSRNQPVKAYNMAILSENSAEINLYGEVMMEAPRDWWTGEVIEGSYIAADEFLKDLEQVKDKGEITIHINSGGGDLYAGLAIYNRLKMLKGKVITINDSLAASAASLIFQAGDVRKMNKGSNLLAHGAAGFLFGSYTIEDLERMVTEFKAHNAAIVNVYAEAMGVTKKEAEKFVKGDNWLTGEEAVEKGLADEVIETDTDEPEDTLMNRFLYKIQNTKSAMTAAVPPIANITEKIGGEQEMTIKNVEELREAYPEYVAQIENAARQEAETQAIENENARIKAIEEIENTILDKELVENAKYGEKKMTAGELALEAMKAQAKAGRVMLDKMKEDEEESETKKVNADPEEEEDTEKKDEDEVKNAFAFYAKLKGGKR